MSRLEGLLLGVAVGAIVVFLALTALWQAVGNR